MLTGSFRKRGRICWYVVDGIRRLMRLLPFAVEAVFYWESPDLGRHNTYERNNLYLHSETFAKVNA